MGDAAVTEQDRGGPLAFEERYVHLNTLMLASLRQKNFSAAFTYADAVLRLCSDGQQEEWQTSCGSDCPAAVLLSMRDELSQRGAMGEADDDDDDGSTEGESTSSSTTETDESSGSEGEYDDEDDVESSPLVSDAAHRAPYEPSADVSVVLTALLQQLPRLPERIAAAPFQEATGVAASLPPQQKKTLPQQPKEEGHVDDSEDDLILADIQKEIEKEMSRLAVVRKNR